MENQSCEVSVPINVLFQPVIGVTDDYQIVYANFQACTTFGYDRPQSMMGQSLGELVHPRARKIHRMAFDSWVKDPVPRSMVGPNSIVEGYTRSAKPVRLRAGLWRDKKNCINYAFLHILDEPKWWVSRDFVAGCILLVGGIILEAIGSEYSRIFFGAAFPTFGYAAANQKKSSYNK